MERYRRMAHFLFEVGIEVDITPVRLSENNERTEVETKNIASVQRANLVLNQVYQLPLEVKKLPFELTDGNDQQSRSDIKEKTAPG